MAVKRTLDVPALNKRPVTTRLLLARHGETDWNRLGRWQGQADIPLNSRGREQAIALRDSLRNEKLAAVYSSTLRRAVETAQTVAALFRVNVSRDERLNEIDLGAWEGMLAKDIMARYPDLWQAWRADPFSTQPPDGETIKQITQRVLQATEEIAQAYPGETVCLIGHKVTNAIVRSHYLDLPLTETLQGEPSHAIWAAIELPYPFL